MAALRTEKGTYLSVHDAPPAESKQERGLLSTSAGSKYAAMVVVEAGVLHVHALGRSAMESYFLSRSVTKAKHKFKSGLILTIMSNRSKQVYLNLGVGKVLVLSSSSNVRCGFRH